MTKLRPSRRPASMRARLLAVESLLAVQPHTAETLARSLGDVTTKTARAYLVTLRDEGRATARMVQGPAHRNGVALYATEETPAESVAEAVAAIEGVRLSKGAA